MSLFDNIFCSWNYMPKSNRFRNKIWVNDIGRTSEKTKIDHFEIGDKLLATLVGRHFQKISTPFFVENQKWPCEVFCYCRC